MANSQALKFLRRTCGKWTSERRYIFAPKFKPVNMVTEFELAPLELGNNFLVTWTGQTTGEMRLTLEGDVLHRSRDYFGDGANSSQVQVIDDDCIVMRTQYDGTRFREEVRLIEHDCYRLRQTVGYNLETGKLVLAGQYFETRLS